ncbi:MAG: ABC transporter ATP-binding protein [Sulfobacillus thermotolerans]|uniref:ABC transporter ATP-binding protein n=1 Tax=Sulfobacillus thermotolerans TaxID=338644 RepID=A0ABM6RUP2_9FIRM|nr:ABC transporter ATP-binding protein [Sulfobacillus thermotolerans]MCY0908537.1 ABC transporter ATP-binding protein [Sulfobacillus thermotolerans]
MISLQNVSKFYPPTQKGGKPVLAVDDFDAQIEAGEFVCIVGPSGCGKTTVLNMVAGFESVSQGDIVVNGVPVRKPGPDRAVVFQQPSLLPWMTVFDNIGFGLTLQEGRKTRSHDKVAKIIEIMGLKGFENHFPYQLSGGMQQRAAIARALITEPQMLLMDEPFGALDAQTRTDMQKFLLTIWDRLRPTVLFITHDVEEAIVLADRVIVMTPRPGRIAQVIDIGLGRPRNWDMVLSPEFLRYKKEVLHILRPPHSQTAG